LPEEPCLRNRFITKHAKPLTRHSSQSEALREHGQRLISGVRDGFVVVVMVAVCVSSWLKGLVNLVWILGRDTCAGLAALEASNNLAR